MADEILINVTTREVRVALLENSVLQEVHIERSAKQGLLGNIYKGKVNRLLPGIQAAFVDIGLERSAFLHIDDVSPGTKDIRDVLRPGQELLVQVYKDPLGTKGARITTQFTIPSRYLVLTPGLSQLAFSQKITDENERERLRAMITPDAEGYIFRTAAQGATTLAIKTDKEFLQTLWKRVSLDATQSKPGDCVYEEIPIVLRVLRDLVGFDIEKIRVDQASAASAMRDFAERYVPQLVHRIEHYTSARPIFDIHSVEEECQKALHRKVYLKSGGHLIFDQTEAMTTIDVNTGSYVGHGMLEETIFKTNQEAVDVIVRQVRLRNLGGIIIIDFIDMSDPAHKADLLDLLEKALEKDPARTEISELSSLGLVQMTRKRTRESLEHILCVTCPLCQRRGSIKSLESVSYEMLREIKRLADLHTWTGFSVTASRAVVEWLQDKEAELLSELETLLQKPIQLREDCSYMQEQYTILPLAEKE